MIESSYLLLAFIFFLIAVLYSSAGFGGGSSYIAVLSFYSLDVDEFRLIALLCNVVVVSGTVYNYANNGMLKIKALFPLLIFSIPMAFIGGSLEVPKSLFLSVLGIILVLASVFMLFFNSLQKNSRKLDIKSMSFIGGSIGFVSGVVGIGGGVFLSPVLHLSRWENSKAIAAACSLFILVNSIAASVGVIGKKGEINLLLTAVLLIAVFAGGQIGSRVSIHFLKPSTLKKIAALLIGLVGIRILYQLI